MNNNIFESKWKQIRAQSKAWWGLFTDDDLNRVEKADIKRDKYVVMLQVKYGYTRERARDEVNKRIADLEADPVKSRVNRVSLKRGESSVASRIKAHPARKKSNV